MSTPHGHDHPVPRVHFTIDGRPLTVDQAKQTAAALLRLAGLDPASYFDLKK